MKEYKYIFCDFDGVLTSTTEHIGSYLNHLPKDYGISDNCFNLLLQLCKMTDAKVVMSSNWRRFGPNGHWKYNGHDYYNQLPEVKRRLGKYWNGCLPKDEYIKKPIALALWFEDSGISEKDLKYVIFDDNEKEGFYDSRFSKHFIHTDFIYGLTKENIRLARNLLNDD